MAPGETYELNVEREVGEELGLARERLELIDHGIFLYEDQRIRTFGGLWTALFDGDVKELKLQAEEVQSIHLQTYEQIQTAIVAGAKYTPDSLKALELQRKAFSEWKEKKPTKPITVANSNPKADASSSASTTKK